MNLTDKALIGDYSVKRSSPANIDHIIELYVESEKLASEALTSNKQIYDLPVILLSFTVLSMVDKQNLYFFSSYILINLLLVCFTQHRC